MLEEEVRGVTAKNKYYGEGEKAEEEVALEAKKSWTRSLVETEGGRNTAAMWRESLQVSLKTRAKWSRRCVAGMNSIRLILYLA